MTSYRVRVSAVLVVVAVLSGCGGHTTTRAGSARASASPAVGGVTASVSSPGSADRWTTANAYERVQRAESSYTGLRGTMTLQESTAAGTFDVGGSFATDLRDFAGPASDLKLLTVTTPPSPVAVRSIGSSVYFRLGAEPWQNVSLTNAASHTAVTAGERDLAAQLVSGLDPAEFTALLMDTPSLKQQPAAAGGAVFTGTVDLNSFISRAVRYDPTIAIAYGNLGVSSGTMTVGFDQRGRPTMLREHVSSAKLNLDYRLTITGYTALKVTAPI